MDNTTHDYSYDYDYNYEDEDNINNSIIRPCVGLHNNYLAAPLSYPYYIMFVFSAFSNGLVLVIIYRFEKLSTVTNILLLNLVISSLIFMGSLPFLAVYTQLENWIFGDAMCKIVGGVHYLGLDSSVLFLTLLTFDRHLAIAYPLSGSRLRTRRNAFISCCVVWLVSGLACITPMIHHQTVNPLSEGLVCQAPRAGSHDVSSSLIFQFYVQLLLFLMAPVVVIVYCYVRIGITVISSKIVTKFKTIRLILLIVIFFFICWIPFNVAQMMYDHAATCEETRRRVIALHVTRNMAYFYCCISPIFYTFVGKKFRNYFRQLLMKRFPSLRTYVSPGQCGKGHVATKTTPM